MRQLRVHGAAGTSPSRILQTDPVRRGDQPSLTTRALRGQNGIEVFDAVDPVADGYDRLSAFRWGNLTSGTPLKAITAFFIPQLAVNAAGWMMPSTSGFHKTFSHAAVRMAALSTTGFITIGLLWFFYVVPSTGCEILAVEDDRSITAFKRAFHVDPALRCRLFADGLSQWVGAALALLSAAALPVVQLARSGSTAAIEPDRGGAPEVVDWASEMAVLERSTATIWLRRLHLALTVTIVGLGVAISNHRSQVSEVGIWIGLAALIGITAAVVWIEPIARPTRRSETSHRMAATALLVAPFAITLFVFRPGLLASNSAQLIPAHFNLVNSVASIGVIALILLLVQSFLLGGDDGQAHLAATSVAGLSLLTGGIVAAALGYVVVVGLNVSLLRDIYGGNVAVVIAFSVTLGLSLSMLILTVIREARRMETSELNEPGGSNSFARSPSASHRHQRRYRLFLAVTAIARTRVRSLLCVLGLFQLAGWLAAGWATTWLRQDANGQGIEGPPVSYFVLIGALAAMVLAALVALGIQAGVSTGPLALASSAGAVAIGLFIWRLVVAPLSTLEQVALVVPLAALLFTVYSGFTDSDSRRGIGIVSDLAGFWPRTFHPLTPRPYSGIAVRQLERLLAESPGPTVVAAHSQGTVLATLALTNIKPERAAEIALITYGSPLGYLYPTVFPAQFVTDEWISSISRSLADRWVNLGRDTDPIASPIAALPDVMLAPGNPGGQPLCGNWFFLDMPTGPSLHSDYEREMPFRETESKLAAQLHEVATSDNDTATRPTTGT